MESANKRLTAPRLGSALNVTVIGGSLAGLMHGIMLRKLGHNVCILEQSLSPIRDNQAAGITAKDDVQAFLREYDTCDESWFSSATGVKVIDKDSKVRISRKMDLCNTSWDVLYYRLKTVYETLESEQWHNPLASIPENSFATVLDHGKRATNIIDLGMTVTVEYEDLHQGVHGAVNSDLVIVAGGASCSLRSMLLPQSDLIRRYSGYVTWRGTVPEKEVSDETRAIFGQENTLYTGTQNYILVYIIPGLKGNLKPGERLLNLVWYCNHSEAALTEILTDVNGQIHQTSLPAGKMRDEVWNKQKADAEKILPPPFLELINKIKHPFITTVSDTTASRASFFNDKVFLVGDALTLFRPHNALSTNQAAYDCLQLRKVLQGTITTSQWEDRVLRYARLNRLQAITWGAYFQVGWAAYLASEVHYRSEMIWQCLLNFWKEPYEAISSMRVLALGM